MRVFAVLIVLSQALVARAEPDPLRLRLDLEDAHERKINGIALTSTGIGLEAAGLALLISAVSIPNSCFLAVGAEEGVCGPAGNPNPATYPLFISGAVISSLATVMLAAGIPLWATGARREKRARQALSYASGSFAF